MYDSIVMTQTSWLKHDEVISYLHMHLHIDLPLRKKWNQCLARQLTGQYLAIYKLLALAGNHVHLFE